MASYVVVRTCTSFSEPNTTSALGGCTGICTAVLYFRRMLLACISCEDVKSRRNQG